MECLGPLKSHSRAARRSAFCGGSAGFFLLLLVFFLFQLFGPNPRIVVSKQTTFITEPLGPDGLPDYEQYVLNLLRDGVTPENNAVALLWQALFPADVDAKFHAAVAAELGLDEVPLESEALESYHSETMRTANCRVLESS